MSREIEFRLDRTLPGRVYDQWVADHPDWLDLDNDRVEVVAVTPFRFRGGPSSCTIGEPITVLSHYTVLMHP